MIIDDLLKQMDLQLDKVLFAYEQIPVVFVCKNEKCYLGVCTNSLFGEYSFLLAVIQLGTLLKVLKDEIPVDKAFELAENNIIEVDWNIDTNEVEVRKQHKYAELSEDDLFDKGIYLERQEYSVNYIKVLEAKIDEGILYSS